MASLMSAVVKKLYGKEMGWLSWPGRKWSGIKNIFRRLKRYLATHPSFRWSMRIAAVMVILGAACAIIITYNKFAQLQTRARALYANLGKELKRRHNLIPNLMTVVREYTIHEADSFKYVSDAREKLISAKGFSEQMKAAEGLENALSKLFALFEQYPDLKATQSAQDLIKELALTENRIAEAKADYNENARAYNQLATMFPGNVLWRLYGFPKAVPYLGINDESLASPEVGSLRYVAEDKQPGSTGLRGGEDR